MDTSLTVDDIKELSKNPKLEFNLKIKIINDEVYYEVEGFDKKQNESLNDKIYENWDFDFLPGLILSIKHPKMYDTFEDSVSYFLDYFLDITRKFRKSSVKKVK